MSFPFGTNYGGVLQCYALSQELIKLGHNVEFLRYRYQPVSRIHNLTQTFKTSYSITNFTTRFINSLRYRISARHNTAESMRLPAFDKFREKYFKFTPILDKHTIGEYLNNNFDAVIIGSDQVWTDIATDEKIFFGDWQPAFKGMTISYAACSAHKAISGKIRPVFKNLLAGFDIITVRDETTATLVSSITGQSPSIVPDPTLLHDFKELHTSGSGITESPYILTYILGNPISGGHHEALRRIKDKISKDCKIVGIVTDSTHKSLIRELDITIYDAGPEEWINLMKGAEAVYTDSFHAILFSMKYNIPFVAYYRDAIRSSRLINLKQAYSLDGIVDKASSIVTLSRHQESTRNLTTIIPQLDNRHGGQ